MDVIANLVSSIGFPIVAYLLMWKHMTDYETKMMDIVQKNTEAINELSKLIQEKQGDSE